MSIKAVRIPLLLTAAASIILLCGCNAFRKTFSRPSPALRRYPARSGGAARTEKQLRQGETGDLLFDTVYAKSRRERREPIRNPHLTDQENRMLNRSRYDDEQTLHQIRQKNRKDNRNKDWVFGTKDGSYF